MNNEKSQDINAESIEEIDTDWIDNLYKNYVDSYVDQITNALEGNAYFKRDDNVNGIPHPAHIMYKLIVNPSKLSNPLNSQDTYQLKPYDNLDTEISTDPHRRYEFVIEFDKETPGYGIYYGCRGLIRDAAEEDINIQAKEMYKEWERIKSTVTTVLNNTFLKKDFTKSFRHTNNIDNYAFWPFWIALQDDEDVIDVAAKATILIYNCYIENLKLNSYQKINQTSQKKLSIETAYTSDAYQKILKEIKENGGNRKIFERFIKKAEKASIITKDNKYEKAWKVNTYSNPKFVTLIFLLWKMVIGENLTAIYPKIFGPEDTEQTEIKPISHKLFDIFITKNGSKFKSGKVKSYIYTNYDPDTQRALLDECKEILSNLLE